MALNVLVVDDSAVMRSMIIKTLGLTQLEIQEIHQAANGQEALDVLARHWIDLALVDINMPVIDGVELVSRIRQMPEFTDLPLIVVSTESSTTRIAALEKEGARFVHKPFPPEKLRTTIVELTGVSVNERLRLALEKTATGVFEQLTFLLTSREAGATQQNASLNLAAAVAFQGPICGTLHVAVFGDLVKTMAANMLGNAEPPTEFQQRDALKEIANVICGNLLPHLMGVDAVYHIDAPFILESGVWPDQNPTAPPTQCQINFQQGRAELQLSLYPCTDAESQP